MQKLKKEKVEKVQKNKITEEIKDEKGITLLALILTVVIMIILAAVTINVALGEGGLVDQAKWAAEQTANVAKSEQEQLDDVADQINDIVAGIGTGDTNSTGGEETNSVETNSVDTNSVDTNSVEDTNTVDTNTIEPEPEPIPDGTITIGEAQWQGDGTANVLVTSSEDSYAIQYQINGTEEKGWKTVQDGVVAGVNHGDTVYARLTDGEQYSEIQNKKIEDTKAPVVTVTAQGSPTTNSITVTAQAVDNESGMATSPKYTYYIKKSTETESSYKTTSGAENITNAQYTFTGLTQGRNYDIKVEVNGDKAGNIGTGTLTNQTTATVPGGEGGIEQGAITFGTATWEDGKASVTIATNTGLQIQYQKNATETNSWTNIENNGAVANLKHGDTIYARLTDGTNYGEYASINIIDNEAPEKATIELNTTNVLIGESITAKVTHKDIKSGVDIENSKWVMNKSASAIGTEDTSAYTGKFTTNPETITLNSSAEGTYYLHVLTIDKAGNKTDTVSNGITISRITGTVTQEGEITWSGGTATLKLATTESQYKIVYKINGEGSWQEYNGTSITGLNHGDKVKACLTNEGQTTYGPEVNITIEDTIAPVVTVTAQGSPTTNSITVTAQAVDNETGMKDSLTYTYYIKKSTEAESSYKALSGAENISNAQYTFTGLTQGTNYDIKVEVNGDKAGNIGIGTLTNQTTATVPGAGEGLETGNITASPAVWSSGKASITLTTTTSFQIEYQVGGTTGSWTKGNSPVTVGNLNHGDTVYARLTDGTNVGNSASITILDKKAPTVSISTGAITENSIEVKVTASSDGESGLVDTNTYKYYANNELKYTGTQTNYTITGLNAGTSYTIKVEAYDKAGNVGTTTTSATTVKKVTESESYVGYYADVDGNGTVDGVIYVDLSTDGGKSGQWGNSSGTYTISTGSNFKKYKVSKTGHSDDFGTKDVLTVSNSSGNERFYVMALDNVDSTHCWYYRAKGNMSDYRTATSGSFGSGKQNTKNMIAKWNSNAYGLQYSNDMWGLSAVQSETWNGSSGWYVPSHNEWSAFGNQLGITTSNYGDKGLSDCYWSSSQYDGHRAWSVYFYYGYMDGITVPNSEFVRLGTTF